MSEIARFAKFILSEAEASTMRAEYVLLLAGSDFAKTEMAEEVIEKYKSTPGLYFWILKHDNAEYKIYLGRTKSLSSRLLNYMSEFQPHSPNDFKLRIFHAFISELVPTASLDLYFSKKELAQLPAAETTAVYRYKPLLNNLPPPTTEARNELKKAFALYYQSVFAHRLV